MKLMMALNARTKFTIKRTVNSFGNVETNREENKVTTFKHIELIVYDSRNKMSTNEYIRKLVESNNGYCDFAMNKAKKSKLMLRVQGRQSLCECAN